MIEFDTQQAALLAAILAKKAGWRTGYRQIVNGQGQFEGLVRLYIESPKGLLHYDMPVHRISGALDEFDGDINFTVDEETRRLKIHDLLKELTVEKEDVAIESESVRSDGDQELDPSIFDQAESKKLVKGFATPEEAESFILTDKDILDKIEKGCEFAVYQTTIGELYQYIEAGLV